MLPQHFSSGLGCTILSADLSIHKLGHGRGWRKHSYPLQNDPAIAVSAAHFVLAPWLVAINATIDWSNCVGVSVGVGLNFDCQ